MNRKDLKEIILGLSLIMPPIMMIIIHLSIVPYIIWLAWVGLVIFANVRKPKRRRKTKFEHFELDKKFVESVELEDIA